MRKLLLFVLLFVICIAFSSCGSDTTNTDEKETKSSEKEIEATQAAIKYNDYMMSIQVMVDEAMAVFIEESDTYSNEEAEIKIEEIGQLITEAKIMVEEQEDFDGKDDFKKAMIKMLDDYYDFLYNEFYALFVNFAGSEDYTDEQWETVEQLYEKFLDKYEKAHDDFNTFQQKFAEKWNFVVNR